MQKISKLCRLSFHVLSRKVFRTQTIQFFVFVLFVVLPLLYNYDRFYKHDEVKVIYEEVMEIETCTVYAFQVLMQVSSLHDHIRQQFGRRNIQNTMTMVCEVSGILKHQKTITNMLCVNGVNQKLR